MISIKYFQDLARRVTRSIYWMYLLSKSDIGKETQISFPVIREGKGTLKIGAKSKLARKLRIGVGLNGSLKVGEKSILEAYSEILINKNCHLNIGDHFKLGQGSRFFVQNDWSFGDNVKIETNCSIFAREPEHFGKLTIGNGSNIGDFTIIDLVNDLTIGNEVAIGPNCTIYTHDHIYNDASVPAWKGGIVSKSIIIEDGAWVGSNVTILPGIIIGKRAVVAAGSIVTKNVSSNCIYGGNPAKLIKEI